MRNLRLEDLSNVSKIIGAGAKVGLKPGAGSPEPMQLPSQAAAAPWTGLDGGKGRACFHGPLLTWRTYHLCHLYGTQNSGLFS